MKKKVFETQGCRCGAGALGALAATVLFAGCFAWGGTLLDDLAFDMEILSDADRDATTADLGDRMTHSAATQGSVTINNGACPAVNFRTLNVTSPFHPDITAPKRCLYFPQGARDVDGVREVAAQNLFIGNAVRRSDVGQSAYIRFRWDGPTSTNYWSTGLLAGFQYAWSNPNGGWGILFNHNHTTWDTAFLGIVSSANMDTKQTAYTVTTNVWYDLVVTTQPTAAGDESRFDLYLMSPRTPVAAGYAMPTNQFSLSSPRHIVLTNRLVTYKNDVGSLKLGALDGSTEFGAQTSNCSQSKTFRGAIADLKIWNRALTEEEVNEIISGSHGARWLVGSANGSADEFGAADDANVAETFDVDAMPTPRLRKELTAAHSSVTLTAAQPENENGVARYLALATILDGAGATCPLTVKANGSVVKTIDLRKERAVRIPENLCMRDANGRFTLTLERTGDLSGAVKIDALSLCGYFQVGVFDKGNGELGHDSTNAKRWYAGDTNGLHYRRGITFGKGNTTGNYNEMVFFLPPKTVEGLRLAFDFRLQNLNSAAWLPYDIKVLLNGTLVSTRTIADTSFPMQIVDLPQDLLHEGMNTIHLRCDDNGDQTEWGWLTWDAVRLRTMRAGQPQGLVMVVR